MTELPAPLVGTPVRLTRAKDPVLRGASGVIGVYHTPSGPVLSAGDPPRVFVHLLSPPAAVDAYPHGVKLRLDALDVTGLPDVNNLPELPLGLLKAEVVNPNVLRRKDACLHGAPPLASTAHLMGEVVALLQLDVSGAAAVAAVDAHARRSPQARHPDVRRVILCMGVDAGLADDAAPLLQFAGLAVALDARPGTDRARDVRANCATPWHARAYLAREAGCQCLSAGRFTAVCASPGCGAVNWGGVMLRECACKGAWYCCEAHQKESWRTHKAECTRRRKEIVGA